MPSCTCGAKGDRGEMVVHMVAALSDPDDTRVHEWRGGDEPAEVAAERAARQAREATLRKLAAAAGVGVDELREALR